MSAPVERQVCHWCHRERPMRDMWQWTNGWECVNELSCAKAVQDAQAGQQP